MNDNVTPPQWNYAGLKKFKAGLSAARKRRDARELKKAFALAAKSPAFRDALDWAQAQGIEFIIDRKTETAGGYYEVGTGVIALAASSLVDEGVIVNILTHEIRHAWQDWHGLIATASTSFEDRYIKTALIEADAFSYGNLAEEQLQSFEDDEETGLQEVQEMENDYLWMGVQNWFSERTQFYGTWVCNELASKLEIQGFKLPNNDMEYQPYQNMASPRKTGISLTDNSGLNILKQKFDGDAYFPSNANNFVKNKILSKPLARSFHGAASKKQKKLVADINRKMKGRELVI